MILYFFINPLEVYLKKSNWVGIKILPLLECVREHKIFALLFAVVVESNQDQEKTKPNFYKAVCGLVRHASTTFPKSEVAGRNSLT